MRYEVTIQRPQDGLAKVYAELKSGTTFIGRIPLRDLITVGDVRALMQVNVLEDGDELGGFALVEPCYDATWRLEQGCEELLVYRDDLAPEPLYSIVPRQRQGQLSKI
jgi:hypothetical protein